MKQTTTILAISALLAIAASAVFLIQRGNPAKPTSPSFSFQPQEVLAQGTERTLVLQQGVEIQGKPYDGCEDTLIYGLYPDLNYGSSGGLTIGRANARALVRFDVKMLPKHAKAKHHPNQIR